MLHSFTGKSGAVALESVLKSFYGDGLRFLFLSDSPYPVIEYWYEDSASTFRGRFPQKLSLLYSGCRLYVGKTGISCVRGSRLIFRLINREFSGGLLALSALVETLTGESGIYGPTGGCKRLLEWVSPKPRYFDSSAEWEESKGYILVSPGDYPDTTKMYDVSACYFSIMKSLQTLYPYPDMGRLRYHKMGKSEKIRYRQLMDAIADNKIIRNWLYGTMRRGKPPYYISDGEVFHVKHDIPNPWANAGNLVCRLADEFAERAADETGSVYTINDCVISPAGKHPESWSEAGFRVRLVAEGECRVNSISSYRVGDKITRGYHDGQIQRCIPAPPKFERRYSENYKILAVGC